VDDQPLIPRYGDANVRGIIPALLSPSGDLPSWMPAPVAGARAVVLLVLDGLGWEQLAECRPLAPTLASMQGGAITTVAPSTTATALTSITTGLTPGEHGVVGYRIEVGGEVLNTLRWATAKGDARRSIEPRRLQPFPPFLGADVPVVSKAELEHSAFTEAHLRGSRPRGWRAASSIAPQVGQLVDDGEPLVYAYYDGVDKVAHERGFGPYYDAELATADAIAAQVLASVPDDVAVVITADHGQVQVGERIVTPPDAVLRLCRASSGEGRFRWLHARAGAAADLLAAASTAHRDDAWVVSREQVLDEQWFGPVTAPPVAARLGDVALVARRPVSFDDPADTGPFPLVCRHGSLTSAEMLVPLLAARGRR
jgi:hypothetical protein